MDQSCSKRLPANLAKVFHKVYDQCLLLKNSGHQWFW